MRVPGVPMCQVYSHLPAWVVDSPTILYREFKIKLIIRKEVGGMIEYYNKSSL